MFWAPLSMKLHRKIDLTNAFRSFFRDDLGLLGCRARARAGPRASRKRATGDKDQEDMGFATDIERAVDKVSGKSLAQGQADLM